jgi:hypothetical protein
MPNKPKVVPIRTNDTPKLVGADINPPAARFILGIGSNRVAFDYYITATRLPARTKTPRGARTAIETGETPKSR